MAVFPSQTPAQWRQDLEALQFGRQCRWSKSFAACVCRLDPCAVAPPDGTSDTYIAVRGSFRARSARCKCCASGNHVRPQFRARSLRPCGSSAFARPRCGAALEHWSAGGAVSKQRHPVLTSRVREPKMTTVTLTPCMTQGDWVGRGRSCFAIMPRCAFSERRAVRGIKSRHMCASCAAARPAQDHRQLSCDNACSVCLNHGAGKLLIVVQRTWRACAAVQGRVFALRTVAVGSAGRAAPMLSARAMAGDIRYVKLCGTVQKKAMHTCCGPSC